jgi:hypothetical protein
VVSLRVCFLLLEDSTDALNISAHSLATAEATLFLVEFALNIFSHLLRKQIDKFTNLRHLDNESKLIWLSSAENSQLLYIVLYILLIDRFLHRQPKLNYILIFLFN